MHFIEKINIWNALQSLWEAGPSDLHLNHREFLDLVPELLTATILNPKANQSFDINIWFKKETHFWPILNFFVPQSLKTMQNNHSSSH